MQWASPTRYVEKRDKRNKRKGVSYSRSRSGRSTPYIAKEFLSHFELLHLTGFSPLHSLRHVTTASAGELAARNGKWEDKAKVSWWSSVHRALILCPGNGILALNPFGLASRRIFRTCPNKGGNLTPRRRAVISTVRSNLGRHKIPNFASRLTSTLFYPSTHISLLFFFILTVIALWMYEYRWSFFKIAKTETIVFELFAEFWTNAISSICSINSCILFLPCFNLASFGLQRQ